MHYVFQAGDQAICVDPQSAEGKALKRIQQPLDEVEWVIDDEDPGSPEDILLEMGKCGYKQEP